jgi:sterol desaturase/sphingolipid hydroxylase (fatty acid hydroxylase superfamily)
VTTTLTRAARDRALLNLWIHSAITLPFFPLRGLSALVRHHDIHHESMKSGYYASITPLWDTVFGTARRPASVSAEDAAVPE